MGNNLYRKLCQNTVTLVLLYSEVCLSPHASHLLFFRDSFAFSNSLPSPMGVGLAVESIPISPLRQGICGGVLSGFVCEPSLSGVVQRGAVFPITLLEMVVCFCSVISAYAGGQFYGVSERIISSWIKKLLCSSLSIWLANLDDMEINSFTCTC